MNSKKKNVKGHGDKCDNILETEVSKYQKRHQAFSNPLVPNDYET